MVGACSASPQSVAGAFATSWPKAAAKTTAPFHRSSSNSLPSDGRRAVGDEASGVSSAASTASKETAAAAPRKGGGGLRKAVALVGPLAAFMGRTEATRLDVTKEVWAYIKQHDLQSPSDRRKIVPDARLYTVVSEKEISMFQLQRHLNKHIKELETVVAEDSGVGNQKQQEQHRDFATSKNSGIISDSTPHVSHGNDGKSRGGIDNSIGGISTGGHVTGGIDNSDAMGKSSAPGGGKKGVIPNTGTSTASWTAPATDRDGFSSSGPVSWR